MAKVKIINLDKVSSAIKNAMNSYVIQSPVLKEIGEFVSDRIRNTTRTGKNIETKTPIKGLSGGYKKYRKKFSEKYPSNTGQAFKPNRSNLTFTGQMLLAISSELKRHEGLLRVFVKESSRRGVPSLRNGKIIPDDKTNLDVAKEVSKDRPFMGIDESGVRRVRQIIVDELRRHLKSKGLKVTQRRR